MHTSELVMIVKEASSDIRGAIDAVHDSNSTQQKKISTTLLPGRTDIN